MILDHLNIQIFNIHICLYRMKIFIYPLIILIHAFLFKPVYDRLFIISRYCFFLDLFKFFRIYLFTQFFDKISIYLI